MEKEKDYEILTTNLQPFFWRKIKNIIRQNQKGALLEFLFGKGEDIKPEIQGSNPAFDDKIQNLQNQISSLQQKIIQQDNLEVKKPRHPTNFHRASINQWYSQFLILTKPIRFCKCKSFLFPYKNHFGTKNRFCSTY